MKNIFIVISFCFLCLIKSYAQTVYWRGDSITSLAGGYGNSSSCQIDLYSNSLTLAQDITENLSRSSIIIEIKNSIPSPNDKYFTKTCSATILAKEGNGNPNPEYYILTVRYCTTQK